MVKKVYKIDFYPSAYKNLEEIKLYWEKILEKNVDNFMAEIYHKTKTLEEFPFAHHQPNDESLREKGYRILPIKNYFVFYVVIENEVQIRRILYNKMDFTKLF